MMYLKVVLLSLVLVVTNVNSIMFHLEPNTQKCLKEELPGNVVVTGEYHVSLAPNQQVHYIIRDSQGHVPSQKEDVVQGKPLKFSYSTDTYDRYEICFISKVPEHHQGMPHEVKLVTKHGVEAKSYEGLAEAAKLKPIEVELKKLEDLSIEIVQGFVRTRENEESMRDTNEATNARVFYFSIFSLFCVVGLSVWQALYLRQYFKSKKLIE